MAGGGAAAATFRCVTQRCTRASLLIDNVSERVQVGRGLMFYVSWLKDAEISNNANLAQTLLKLKLLESSDSENQFATKSLLEMASLDEGPVHILVIPQANLASKVKGGRKQLQYHSQLKKADGAEEVYLDFIEKLKECATKLLKEEGIENDKEERIVVRCGTFGNRQSLNFESNGPFTHMFEF